MKKYQDGLKNFKQGKRDFHSKKELFVYNVNTITDVKVLALSFVQDCHLHFLLSILSHLFPLLPIFTHSYPHFPTLHKHNLKQNIL